MNLLFATVIVGTACTLMMTGVIWFVQVVHYPLLRRVGQLEFSAYEREHTRRTSLLVAPLMVLELAFALALLWFDLPGLGTTLARLGAVLAVLIWICTFTIQVPLHRRLSADRDTASIERLVRSNVIRVALWSARAAIMMALCTIVPG
jgi:hypothetical protein